MSILSAWTLLRTFNAQAAEGHAALPAKASFIAIPGDINTDVEVSMGAYDVSGGVPANAATMAGGATSGELWIWALHDDGTIMVEEPIAKVILAAADTGAFSPVIIRTGAAKLYVTWDATTPAGGTFTGKVHARRVSK